MAFNTRLDRVEIAYLAVLRIAVLIIATLGLLTALYFAGDALWRLAVRTEVETAGTAVAPAEVTNALTAMNASSEAATQGSPGSSGIPAHVRQRHATFARTVFPQYYAIYRQASTSYKKQEDRTLTAEQLMAELGYDLGSYAAGETTHTKRMVENAEYGRQAIQAVTAAMRAPRTVALLRAYKDAQRSEQRCTITNTTQLVRRTCGYYYVYDCSITRTVPVRRCAAVYPDGIISPGCYVCSS